MSLEVCVGNDFKFKLQSLLHEVCQEVSRTTAQQNSAAKDAVAGSGDADATIVSREPGTYAPQKGMAIGKGHGKGTPLAQQALARNAARGSRVGDAIGDSIEDAIGDSIGGVIGKGTPLAQQARNAATKGRRVCCPASDCPYAYSC